MPELQALFGDMPIQEDGTWSIVFGILHERHPDWHLDWTAYRDAEPAHVRMVITADVAGDADAGAEQLRQEVGRAVEVANRMADEHPLGSLRHIDMGRVTVGPAAG